MNTFQRLLLSAGCVIALVGCGSSVKLDDKTAPVDDRAAAGAAGAGAGANGSQVGQINSGEIDPLNDPSSPLAKRSIYFDFDSYTIRAEYRATVEAHARYLISNRERKLVVQGNTDDRGSREYNLALGQKRAEAVRKALITLGATENQLEAVSFGEEKPRATGSDEASWAENRRADLAYQ
jgi:peptidoglycan-associated lipoprotein